MRKFCTKCGRKLEKDEVCTCEKIKKDNYEGKEKMNIIDKISEFLKNPNKAFKNIDFLEGNEYIMLILSSLSFGFLNYLNYFGYHFRSIIVISLLAFLFFIILSFILSVIKKQIEYQDSVKIVSISSIILFCSNLIALLFSFLSLFLALLIILFGLLLFILYCYQGFIEQDNSEYNAYEISLSLFASIIMIFLIIIFL